MEKVGLRELRKKENLTLERLSELSGVSAMYISELERGIKKNPSAQILKNLADILGVKMDRLLAELESKSA